MPSRVRTRPARVKTQPKKRGMMRKQYRRKNVRTNASIINRALPESVLTTLEYCEQFTSTTTVTPNISRYYSVVNLFDPTASTGGHQPYMWDYYAGLYNRYRVYGMKITCEFVPITTGVTAYCGLIATKGVPTTDLSGVSPDVWIEKNNVQVHSLVNQYKMRKHSLYLQPWKLYGITKLQGRVNTDFDGTTDGSSVPFQYYVAPFHQNVDLSTSTNMSYTVKIRYYVRFWDRTIQSQS